MSGSLCRHFHSCFGVVGGSLAFEVDVTPLLLPRFSRSHGSRSAVFFLAEECVGHLDCKDARRHLPCTERHPGLEPSLDHLRTHQPDDSMVLFGCGDWHPFTLGTTGKERPLSVQTILGLG